MNHANVPFGKPGPRSAAMHEALMHACDRVLGSHDYILGPEVREFELSWAATLEARGAVGVASGLDALEIAMRAAGVGPGDEVILPAVSAMATALAVLRTGASPVFCDVDYATGLMSLEHAKSLLTERTRCLLPVHLYGRAVNMSELGAWAEDAGVYVVEDAAQAHFAKWDGRFVGTWGIAAAFSFYPTKNLGAIGDAGALVSMNEGILERARILRNYGQISQYDHVTPGLNSRLDELQAAILRVRLAWLEQDTAIRQEIAQRYFRDILNESVTCLDRPSDPESYVAHLFVVLVEDRAHFMDFMAASGVECLVHYPRALPDQYALHGLCCDSHLVPSSRKFTARCVSLPCNPALTPSEVDRVISVVNAYQGP